MNGFTIKRDENVEKSRKVCDGNKQKSFYKQQCHVRGNKHVMTLNSTWTTVVPSTLRVEYVTLDKCCG